MRIFVLLVMVLFSHVLIASPVNINEADAEQISEALIGVGPAKAAAIIKYRTENGPFETVDELSSVKGIGLKTLEKNRSDIVVNSAKDMSS